MKKLKSLLLLSSVIIASLVWVSCEKTDSDLKGTFDFGMNPLVETALKSLDADRYDVVAALVSVVSETGELVFDKEYIEFYKWGETFVTKKLTIGVGEYKLSEFMLLDSMGTVIWATPLEGSELAHLVDDPLPMWFSVSEGVTTHLYPQVVKVSNYNPDDFGYVTFHVDFIDKACLKVFFTSPCMDWYYEDSTFYLDSTIYMNADGTFMPYWAPRIAFFTNGDLVSESFLFHGENEILFSKKYREYQIVVYDCGNQICFNEFFGLEELKQFSCTSGDFLQIDCNPSGPEVIITPEDLSKPNCEQGIFGQLFEEVYDDTINYQENFNVRPAVADLHIYKYSTSDTLYAYEGGLYVYPDPNIQPYAIVRSNTKGYFSLALESGEYQYLVNTPMGYYVDAYLSSRQGGRFVVNDGQITKFSIVIKPNYWY